jgi:hypothetical protein
MSTNTYSALIIAPFYTDIQEGLAQLEGNNLTPLSNSFGNATSNVGIDLTVQANLSAYLNLIGQSGNQQLIGATSKYAE